MSRSRADAGHIELTGSGWRGRLLLPPGWATLPTDDPQRSRQAVNRLLTRQLAHLPRDRTATARRVLTRELVEQLADARRAGASAVHTQVQLMRGLPVTAGLTVLALPAPAAESALLPLLARVFGDASGVLSTELTHLAELPAVRRHRRVEVAPVEGQRSQQPFWRTHLDWVVTLPDGDYLVLAFSTSTDPVAGELVQLFDAIAASLELVPAPAPR